MSVALRPVGRDPGLAVVDVDGVPMSARLAEVPEPRAGLPPEGAVVRRGVRPFTRKVGGVNASYVALLLVRVVVGATMIAHGMNHWRGGGKIAAGLLATFWQPK
jgi:hypothetical protein